MYRKMGLAAIVVLCLMMCRGLNGELQNCIDAADTTITTVATPAVVEQGGATHVQCQVSPPSKAFCSHRMTFSSPSVQFHFDKTNCPRGAISESRYTAQCNVTAGRYGIRITNVRIADAGRWECNYMNMFQGSGTVLDVVVHLSGPVLTFRATTAYKNIVTVHENSPLTIACDGSYFGATGLTYRCSGVNLSGQSNNKLSFTQIRRTDSGVYTCYVTYSNLNGTKTGSITINVQYFILIRRYCYHFELFCVR
ncbi:uncharacterized protein LOC141902834 isoform X2 [Tubulanus polymorphus]|uniref:uncharacterized protein LOC141902834 isoform X2 n=1 Tax=Tubulanus polymorphus TaxID=672921 RepID=UPI003DA55F71